MRDYSGATTGSLHLHPAWLRLYNTPPQPPHNDISTTFTTPGACVFIGPSAHVVSTTPRSCFSQHHRRTGLDVESLESAAVTRRYPYRHRGLLGLFGCESSLIAVAILCLADISLSCGKVGRYWLVPRGGRVRPLSHLPLPTKMARLPLAKKDHPSTPPLLYIPSSVSASSIKAPSSRRA